MNIVLIKDQNPRMRGLLLKELKELKRYKGTLISSIVIFSILAIFQLLSSGETAFLDMLPLIITFCFGIFSISNFSHDEAAKTDRYVKSLPVDTKEVVKAKYTFVICATVIGAAVGIFLNSIISLFLHNGKIWDSYILEILTVPIGCVSISSIIEAIQIPCIYKFGTEKARMHMLLIIAILIVMLALIIGGIFYWLEKINITIYDIELFIPSILILLTIFAYNMSYRISCKIYEKKEF